MKSTHSFALGLAGLFLALPPISLCAEDWTTTDGKVYKDVKVVKAEPDAVTITDHDGGARIPMDKLPQDLQIHFNYDPAKAKAAAEARTQADAKNAVVLQAEMDQAQKQKLAEMAATDPRFVSTAPAKPVDTLTAYSASSVETTDDAPITVTTPTGAQETPQITPTSSDPLATSPDSTHHSMESLVDINSRLKDDHPSPNRHTMASLLLASKYLMPDPLDPNHHSTGQLLESASVLMPNPDDPSHHSTSALVHSAGIMTPPQTDTGNRHSTNSLTQGDPLAHP